MKKPVKTKYLKNYNHSIRPHYFMANRGEKVQVVTDFFFLGSKITADGDCSHEIRRRLLLVKKAVTNPDSVKKQTRSFGDKGPTVKATGFPVVMCGCKS